MLQVRLIGETSIKKLTEILNRQNCKSEILLKLRLQSL